MIQAFLLTLILGLFGLLVLIVLKTLGFSADHQTDDKREGSVSPKCPDEIEPREHASRQSNAAA
jgi:hypothetical protein